MSQERLRDLRLNTIEFFLWVGCFLVMYVLVYGFGNPRIADSVLCYHHIPEMFGFYYLGGWIFKHKIKFRFVMGLYLFTVFSLPANLSTGLLL